MGSDKQSDADAGAMPCHECRYDLRAGVEVCSECGHPVAESAAAWQREASRVGPVDQLRRSCRRFSLLIAAVVFYFVIAALIPLFPYPVGFALQRLWARSESAALLLASAALTCAAWPLRKHPPSAGREHSRLGWIAIIALVFCVVATSFRQLNEWFGDPFVNDFWLRDGVAVGVLLIGLASGLSAHAWRISVIATGLQTSMGIACRPIAMVLTIGGVAVFGIGLSEVSFPIVYYSVFFQAPTWVVWILQAGGLLFLLACFAFAAMLITLWIWSRKRLEFAKAATSSFDLSTTSPADQVNDSREVPHPVAIMSA